MKNPLFIRRPFHKVSPALPWLLSVALGLGAGLLNGLLGAAGGILLVTVLPRLPLPSRLATPDLQSNWESRDLLATSLSVMLPVSGVSLLFYGWGGIRPSPLLFFSLLLPAALGGWLGARLLGRLPDRLVKKIFAALVVVAGLRMLL